MQIPTVVHGAVTSALLCSAIILAASGPLWSATLAALGLFMLGHGAWQIWGPR